MILVFIQSHCFLIKTSAPVNELRQFFIELMYGNIDLEQILDLNQIINTNTAKIVCIKIHSVLFKQLSGLSFTIQPISTFENC